MQRKSKSASTALIALLLLLGIAAHAASPADEKDRVLRKLDAAAANFRSTSADFQFDSVQTDPVPVTDTQKGTVYYERKKSTFQMAAHILEFNKKPAMKVYTYSAGVFRLFEGGNLNQVTTYSKVSKFESYLMLGFGASGKDLEQKWEIKYLGSENLPDGKTSVKTEKLELVAKDPAVRKYFSKVTVWIDTDHAVSLKQVFDEGPGEYRVCVYFNIRNNQPLPADAFTFKTDSHTVYSNR
jgi:outer membrane lipoprotein-sorting protein